MVRVGIGPLLAALILLAGCGGARATAGHDRAGPSPVAGGPRRGGRGAAAPQPDLGPRPLRGAAARRARVPVLMYHLVASPPAGTAYPELWVQPRRFAAEMLALRRAGYRGVTLEAVLRAWRHGTALPRRPVVVTFDDGSASQYKHAFPTLRGLGWPGVLNLELHDLGPGGIRVREVRALLRGGWELDSHTMSHPDLTAVGDTRLRTELVASRRAIRRRFGAGHAALFCYPAGRYDARVERAVRRAGYAAATTTQPGLASPAGDRFALPRVRVTGAERPAGVLAAISAAARSG